jgi:hypothetical protein
MLDLETALAGTPPGLLDITGDEAQNMLSLPCKSDVKNSRNSCQHTLLQPQK